ncbi:MAG: glycosyltransferase involved in cell wall biosynthesis [Candidatus Azotimanducaceae bacterium]|jgi:glycosyltransferase involved in cell wall biosynthesis
MKDVLKIVIVSGFPLSMNPRVVKEADALSEAGHKVTVLTAIFSEIEGARETAIASHRNWRCVFLANAASKNPIMKLHWLCLRARRAFFNLLHLRFGFSSHYQLGYCSAELLRYCKKNRADHYSLHLESSLATAPLLSSLSRRYSVDFEDWYSHDLAEAQQEDRPSRLIETLELQALKGAVFSTAASNAMAAAIHEKHGNPHPITLYNCFELSLAEPVQTRAVQSETVQSNSTTLRICWFSQTVGATRGLEELLAATNDLDRVEVHLIGNCSSQYKDELLSIDSKTQFHGYISADQLADYLENFHIGYAGETSKIVSRDLTVTNKVFQYLLAGLPIIASKTQGQIEMAQQIPAAFHLFSDKETLIAGIRYWQITENLAKGKSAALDATTTRFNWEIESAQLLEAISSSS